jgi:DNA topoisomerase-1
VRALVIPPAWGSVWICADPRGHIQAVGEDERGRRQYRYHPLFRAHREEAKFAHMLAFARALPDLREKVAHDMGAPGLSREKVLATVVRLLETTMIRVGNASYARSNHSYGLTTLLSRHVDVEGSALRFHFKGKSGRSWRLGVRDRRVARIVRSCQDLPGQHLFQYLDDAGERRVITSADVNAYLREATGADITAKDFRTWHGTVLAAVALAENPVGGDQGGDKRVVTEVIRQVASRLGNTPTICRKCYVHPQLISAYLDEGLTPDLAPAAADSKTDLAGLHPEEAAVIAFLNARS